MTSSLEEDKQNGKRKWLAGFKLHFVAVWGVVTLDDRTNFFFSSSPFLSICGLGIMLSCWEALRYDEEAVCGHVVEMVFLVRGEVINAICYVFEGWRAESREYL